MNNSLLAAAEALQKRGLSVFPLCGKAPAVEGWQKRVLTPEELRQAFKQGGLTGVGMCAGRLSGNIAVLDFDRNGWAAGYENFMRAWPEAAGTAQIETGKGRRHGWLRCHDLPDGFTNETFARPDLDCAIELRGNESNCACPPSKHPETGKPYQWVDNQAGLKVVSFAELYGWLAEWSGKESTTWTPPTERRHVAAPSGGEAEGSPGNDYARRGPWRDVLVKHGWTFSHEHDGEEFWTRPGKSPKDGHSATFSPEYGAGGVFYCFSEASEITPLEPKTSYSPFALYTTLEHAGDFTAAAKALAAQGYGEPKKPATLPADAPLPDVDAEHVQCPSWADMSAQLGPIAWDWPNWLAKGFLHLLASQSGEGKSALALRLAGCYLLGWPWPDGSPFEGETGAVLWAEAESAQAVNLSRATAWKLPLDRILAPMPDALNGFSLDSAEHRAFLKISMERPDVRFCVVDSLRGATNGDENDSAGIAGLQFLAGLARDTGKPILLTHHLRKRGIVDVGEGITLDRLRGSSAIAQLTRVVWAVDCPDVGDKEARRLSVIKSNLARFPEPCGFRIDDAGLHFERAPEPPRKETVSDKAADLLLSLLAPGPMPAEELRVEFDMAGISWRSVNRVKEKLGIVSVRKVGGDGETRWHWSLPARGRE